MRKRFQKGSVKKVKGKWIGQWWEDGHRRNQVLGRTSEMTKAAAQSKIAEIVRRSTTVNGNRIQKCASKTSSTMSILKSIDGDGNGPRR